MKKILPLTLTVLLTACNSNPNKVVAVKVGDDIYKTDMVAAQSLEKDNDEKIVCETRRKTGSHFKERICTTKSQKEKERDDARRTLEQNGGITTKSITEGRDG